MLGVATIVSYGAASYGYGVLIQPIAASTGWSATRLGAIFSAALVLAGLIGVLGGRLLDRHGTTPLFLVVGTAGAGLLALSAALHGYAAFAATYASACGLIGGLGFYHVTQPAAARAEPGDPAAAIVRLTIIGVFSSPIYLPATAWLVTALGWREAILVHAATVAVTFLAAAVLVRTPPAPAHPSARREPTGSVLRDAARRPVVRRWIVATVLSGAAADVLLVYQVPAMVAAGLPLAAAATLGGARGFAQILGRLPLRPVLRRHGSRRALVGAHLIAAAGAVALAGSGLLPVAIAYTVLAGASIGSLSALQGIYTHELVEPRHLGVLFGAQQALYGVAGATGPILAGLLLDATGSYALLLGILAATFVAAALVLARPG